MGGVIKVLAGRKIFNGEKWKGREVCDQLTFMGVAEKLTESGEVMVD